MKKITPEEMGISSKDIYDYVNKLNSYGLTLHGILMEKSGHVFFETYYKPYNKYSIHRMYSQTKSYTSFAIGILLDKGLIKLEDKIVNFFPEYNNLDIDQKIKEQTILDSLKMSTVVSPYNWFDNDLDRIRGYLLRKEFKDKNTFSYDTNASFILGAIVEKVSGMKLFDFLNKNVFRYLGTFKRAYMLKCPKNYSWADSGLMCTLRDMVSFSRLILDDGKIRSKQLISKDYILQATTKKIDTESEYDYKNYGYGYQVWMTKEGYAFYGMGNSITLFFPKKDIIVSFIASDQGFNNYRELMINELYKLLNKEPSSVKINLDKEFNNQKLLCYKGINKELLNEINNKTYYIEECFMKEFTFKIKGNKGKFIYKDTKYRTIKFKIEQNKFSHLPIKGYSNYIGGLRSNIKYKIASSLKIEDKIYLYVQIIDKYLGSLFITFDVVNKTISFEKHAENFLNEYQGTYVIKQ